MYNSFTKTELFHRVLQNIYFDIKDNLFRRTALVNASKTREYKDMYQIRKRDSVFFCIRKIIMSKQRTPTNISIQYP